jgi:hypothetical protein
VIASAHRRSADAHDRGLVACGSAGSRAVATSSCGASFTTAAAVADQAYRLADGTQLGPGSGTGAGIRSVSLGLKLRLGAWGGGQAGCRQRTAKPWRDRGSSGRSRALPDPAGLRHRSYRCLVIRGAMESMSGRLGRCVAGRYTRLRRGHYRDHGSRPDRRGPAGSFVPGMGAFHHPALAQRHEADGQATATVAGRSICRY